MYWFMAFVVVWLCDENFLAASGTNHVLNHPNHAPPPTLGKNPLTVVIYYIEHPESDSALRISKLWWECNNIGP